MLVALGTALTIIVFIYGYQVGKNQSLSELCTKRSSLPIDYISASTIKVSDIVSGRGDISHMMNESGNGNGNGNGGMDIDNDLDSVISLSSTKKLKRQYRKKISEKNRVHLDI
jgi:hypothetical protein